MNLRKIINRRIRHSDEGVHVVGDINAVISGNVGQRGTSSHVSRRQRTRIVQKSGRTQVAHEDETTEGGG